MTLLRRVRKRGSSLTVVIPAHLASMLAWRPEDYLEITVAGDSLVLRRAREAPPPSTPGPRPGLHGLDE